MNQYHFWRNTATLLLSIGTLVAGEPARAATPEQTSINDILGNSSELLIRRSGRRESAQVGSVLQQVRDALITAPPNNARALLRFLSGDGEDLNLYVQTNPHPESAIYYFPCQFQGGNYLIGWGLARNESRGCENGMQAMRGRSTTAQQFPDSPAQAAKQLAQEPVRQVFYCSVMGSSVMGSAGTRGFATSNSNDPCPKAVQDCQAAGGSCEVVATGFWWTTEEPLQARLDCAAAPASTAETFTTQGTGKTIEAQIQTLLQQTPGQSCSLQVERAQDVLIVPAPDDVVLALGDDEILVQVRDTPTGLQIDVLKGAINVRSQAGPELRQIRRGERYVHSETGGSVSSFNRQDGLTSVDMEVLCAFSSNTERNLTVSACKDVNLNVPLNPETGQPTIAFCDREQGSGGQEGDRRTVQMSTNRGEIELEYEMFTVPDRFQILYEGREILDTGFTSGANRLTIPFSGKSGRVDVIVTGNQVNDTQWNYTLYCP